MVMELLLLIPVFGGSLYSIFCVVSTYIFYKRSERGPDTAVAFCPKLTILKPIHGLEKNLAENLRSACTQDYPDYQVVLSVQNLDDPALPLLKELHNEFGENRVSVVAIESTPIVNGKVQNLINAMTAVKHDYIVISDSDVLLKSDYLKSIMAPLSDPRVGYVCTLYRGTHGNTWYGHLEQLTYNADFIPSVIFSYVSKASSFCLGASIALKRSTLEAVGGLEELADYLVEDYELGRRILASGYKAALVNHNVDLVIDLKSPVNWWQHQLYWDQNTWSAQPMGFFLTIFTKGTPFSFIYALVNLFSLNSVLIFFTMVTIRSITAAYILMRIQGEFTLKDLLLLPLRDTASLFSWCAAICKRKFIWRGHEFSLTRGGRIVPRSL
jgi:ceramide glucosyltransferase